MQKSKSSSLSEKDKQKILHIIHSKVNPLKFKFKKHQSHIHANHSPIPKLRKSEWQQEEQKNRKKRISLSTYIEKTCPIPKKTVQESQLRDSVLSTENIKNQQELLAALISQSSSKQNIRNPNKLLNSFQDYTHILPVQYLDKLVTQLSLLQRKKMLKNVKLNVEKKKQKLFLELMNDCQHKKEHKQLNKKYNPDIRNVFKQLNQKNTQSHQLLNLKPNSKHEIFQLRPKHNQFRNSVDFCVNDNPIMFIDENDQNKKSQHVKEQNEAIRLKEFIDFFKEDQQQSKRLMFEHYSKLRNQTTSKFIHYPPFPNLTNFSSFQGCRRKQSLIFDQNFRKFQMLDQESEFKQRRSFMNKTIHVGMQKAKQGMEKVQFLDPTLTNAKMRMRSNHKKIVSLGKMQRTASVGKNYKYETTKDK